MGKTNIQWTAGDDGSPGMTWNPVVGCDKVSPGCDHCYAETIAERFRGGPGYPNGFEVTLKPHKLDEPLRWRKPRRVFVNSMSDLFHPKVPDEFIARAFAVMALARRHTFQVLTKRPARMRALLDSSRFGGAVALRWREGQPTYMDDHLEFPWPLPNVWLGCSVEDQERADQRIPLLLRTPASVRFLSCEPLLGPIDLSLWTDPTITYGIERLGWVICGGESGPHARPMNPQWARDLRDQCQTAGLAFFMKQLGAWRPLRNGEYPPPGPTVTVPKGHGRDAVLARHGGHNGDPKGWPEDLRIRQFPDSKDRV